MKIVSLKLDNFRNFYGENEITFSLDEQKKITLIHAENTFGKTSLLNAILYTFHEEFTPAFNDQGKLINKEAYAEGKTKGYCEVRFVHDEDDYVVRRNFTQNSQNSHSSSVVFFKIVDGEFISSPDYQNFINALIPKDIAKYFFFDGEGAEAFHQNTPAQKKKNENAIRDIIGCQYLEWASDDFRYLAKKFQKNINELAGKDEQAKRLNLSIRDSESKIETLELNLSGAKKGMDSTEKEMTELQRSLTDIHAVKEIAEERMRCKKNLSAERDNLKRLQGEKLKWFGQFAITFFAEGLCQTKELEFEKKDKKAEIPEKYSEPFIKGLLEDELCICGRPLSEHGDEYNKVKKLIDKSSDDAMITNYNSARAFITGNNINKRTGDEKLKSIFVSIQKTQQRIDNLEKEEKKYDEKFQFIEDKKVQELEKLLKKATDQNRVFRQKHATYENDLKVHKDSLAEDQRTLNNIVGVSDQSVLLNKKKKLAEDMADYSDKRLSELLSLYRRIIKKKFDELISPNIPAQEEFLISADFSFELKDHLGNTGGLTKGSGVLASLAFTSFLIEVCKNERRSDALSTIAPLVLDAPFSVLDQYLMPVTAQTLRDSSEQLMIFVNSKDYEVISSLVDDAVGKRYVLLRDVVNKSSEGDQKIKRTLKVKDQEFNLVNFEKPIEKTIVEEIR